ncbi:hypothetical protein B484DRAFT_411535 [Ochromonadaceae sp. CCMP2298]|nr:hypothetical protein B484DRAFT_411535 [Ochromonadaceae sp. CCMP2298]
MRVDSHVRVIPLLVLDARTRALLLLDLGACSVCTPVLVLNEVWFRTNYAVFREGMEGVFRISQSFVGVDREPDGMARFIAATAFPLSSRRAAMFTIPKTDFDVACLLEPCGAHDRLYSQYKFRCALADAFSSELCKNANKTASVSFELRVAPQDVAVLFGWPALLSQTAAKVQEGAAANRMSFICCEDMMRTPALMKDLVSLSVPDSSLLSGLLGTTYRYFVLADSHHRYGGFSALKYTAILPTGAAPLTFAYDLTTDTLFVRAKVQKVSRAVAVGESLQLKQEDDDSQERKRQCV